MKFPTLSQNQDPVLRRMDRIIELFILIGILSFTLLVCCSCSVTKTIPIETIKEVTKIDTIYLNTFRFDSTYVSHERSSEYHRALETSETLKPDTLYITETNIEYRYRILRDTVERVKIEVVHDSIPYEVRVETIKEVPRPRTWFDHLCRYSFFLMCGALLLLVYKFIRKFI